MNCIEAQAQLAVYRELKDDQVDAAELSEHLEQCAACRQVLAQYSLVSERIQSLPAIEAPPDMHEKLMQALATEHTKFSQRAAPGTPPPPEFLKPYLQEPLKQASKADPLTTFSTAETGPLPIIHTTRKRRRSALSQFAVLGLAATFLLALLVGGLTSLLMLAHSHKSGELVGGAQIAIQQPTTVVRESYTTDTPYPYVMSAVADHNSIYYAAYGDNPDNGWMLEQLDRITQVSTPLLATPSASPLIVLGSQNGWLVWLQLDAATPTLHQHLLHYPLNSAVRTWSLHYIPVGSQGDAPGSGEPYTILSGTFDPMLASGMVHSPVQGVWFTGNTLLIAALDDNGISHLWSYQLGTGAKAQPVEIMRASAGHILTSPTANSDGSKLFWADEWLGDDGALHSNIWTQQNIPAPRPMGGRWQSHTVPQIWQFRTDGTSFRPVVIANTLFMLNTNDALDGTLATTSPTAVPNARATPGQSTLNSSTISAANSSIYMPPLDNYVSGTLFMLSLDSNSLPIFNQVSTVGHVSGLQGGTNFVLWQEDNNSFGMFDAKTGIAVHVGSVLDNAQFVSVNGDSTAWTTNGSDKSLPAANSVPAATIMTFSWPPETTVGK